MSKRYPIPKGDERNPVAKVPFLIAEIKRQQRQLDAAAVEKLIADTQTGYDNDKEESR